MDYLDHSDLEYVLYGCDMDIWLRSDELELLYYCKDAFLENLESSIYLYATKSHGQYKDFFFMNEEREYKIVSIDELNALFDGSQRFFIKKLEQVINSGYFKDWDIKEGKCDYKKCCTCENLSSCNNLFEEEKEIQIASSEFWAEYALHNPIDC